MLVPYLDSGSPREVERYTRVFDYKGCYWVNVEAGPALAGTDGRVSCVAVEVLQRGRVDKARRVEWSVAHDPDGLAYVLARALRDDIGLADAFEEAAEIGRSAALDLWLERARMQLVSAGYGGYMDNAEDAALVRGGANG